MISAVDPQITHMGLFLIAGLLTPVLIKLIQYLLAPNIPRLHASKNTYECGEKPIGDATVRYNTQFFTFAIVFVVFDILSILFLLWAYAFRLFSGLEFIAALTAIGSFAGLLLIGLFFWLKKGVLTWA
ncbi:MAG: NADH-quinone oxidoreductase subunit A [Candidatus Thorarchaeota archaeon]